MGPQDSWAGLHILDVPEEPIPWGFGPFNVLNLIRVDNAQGRLPFDKTSKLIKRLRKPAIVTVNFLLAPPTEHTIVELPEGIVPALVGRHQSSFPLVPGQASASGDVDEMDRAVTLAPHPLLVLLPS